MCVRERKREREREMSITWREKDEMLVVYTYTPTRQSNVEDIRSDLQQKGSSRMNHCATLYTYGTRTRIIYISKSVTALPR